MFEFIEKLPPAFQKKSLKYQMPFLSPGVHNNRRKKVGVWNSHALMRFYVCNVSLANILFLKWDSQSFCKNGWEQRREWARKRRKSYCCSDSSEITTTGSSATKLNFREGTILSPLKGHLRIKIVTASIPDETK